MSRHEALFVVSFSVFGNKHAAPGAPAHPSSCVCTGKDAVQTKRGAARTQAQRRRRGVAGWQCPGLKLHPPQAAPKQQGAFCRFTGRLGVALAREQALVKRPQLGALSSLAPAQHKPGLSPAFSGMERTEQSKPWGAPSVQPKPTGGQLRNSKEWAREGLVLLSSGSEVREQAASSTGSPEASPWLADNHPPAALHVGVPLCPQIQSPLLTGCRSYWVRSMRSCVQVPSG